MKDYYRQKIHYLVLEGLSLSVLRRRVASTSVLIQRAQGFIDRVPNASRRIRLQRRLNQIKDLPPEERLWAIIKFLAVVFLLAGVAMAIGYAITGK